MTEHEIILADLTVMQCEFRRLLSKAEAFEHLSSKFADNLMPAELVEVMCEVYQKVETSTESIGGTVAKAIIDAIAWIIKKIVELIKINLKFVFANAKKIDTLMLRLNKMKPDQIALALDHMNHSIEKNDAFVLLEAWSYFNSGLPTYVADIKKDGVKGADDNDVAIALRLLGYAVDATWNFVEYDPSKSRPAAKMGYQVAPDKVASRIATRLNEGRYITSAVRADADLDWTPDLLKTALYQLSSLCKGMKAINEKRIENQATVLEVEWTKNNKGADAAKMLQVVMTCIQVHTKILIHVNRHLTRMGQQVVSGSPIPNDTSSY